MQGRAGVPMTRVRRLRWRGWWWKLPLLAMGVSVAQVLTLRFVDPPFSSFMAIRQLEAIAAGDLGYRMAHDWRDLRDISPQLALAIAALAPTVRYAKVETLPVVARVAAMTEAVSDQLTIIGGAGGSYFIEEMRRGARATMPFSSQPAEFVEVWNRFQAGDEAGARRAFDSTIMAVNRLDT